MGPTRAIFLNNRYSISVHQFERCFAFVNFNFVNIDDVVRFALVLLVERLLLGKSYSTAIDEALLKFTNNLNEFDEYI